MRFNHVVSLLQKGYTTIVVQFGGGTGQFYAYKCPVGVKVGDYVVVEMPGQHFRVLPVVQVHDTPRIDVEADFDYRWVIQVVDFTAYNQQMVRESEAIQLLVEQEMDKKRQELLAGFMESTGLPGPKLEQLENLLQYGSQTFEVSGEE